MLPINLDQTQVDVGKGHGLPSLFYISSEVLSLERKEIFGSAWQYAVHRDQIREPNSYAVTSLGEFSVVVTRDVAGAIRAFRTAARLSRKAAARAPRCGAATILGSTRSTGRCAPPRASSRIRA
jgi:hypothetical protein